ncbi:L-lysine 2,3-aminomutase [Psilocybe cubensis]|uniref:L-lysine 2,3-aminomutase n=1 Tax=Psilocybe cubensis TaxID=181762 RepID=A0ACB8GFL2_PSICU|nr:L-lysine 2,3-aminomutase [Psilocybe cubensis]KAH9474399.1 L-lysine 2,3-aminomutase [Psilocybe cubensis]
MFGSMLPRYGLRSIFTSSTRSFRAVEGEAIKPIHRATYLPDLAPGDYTVTNPHPSIFDLQQANNVSNSPSHITGVTGVNLDIPYWKALRPWKDVEEDKFLSYQWQVSNSVQGEKKLREFLADVLPNNIPSSRTRVGNPNVAPITTAYAFIESVSDAISKAPMAIRLTPHILSVIDWSDPVNDPIRRQFIPLGSELLLDHHRLKLDSLNEEHDSPVKGLVHRYPTKALFLVGANTDTVTKNSLKPTKRRWDEVFNYIENTPQLNDIVVSGGDSFYLSPEQLYDIGKRLLEIPHIRRFRFATKGLAVVPCRILDPQDTWSAALIAISDMGKKMGKAVAVHTHFNHPNEITWITRLAAQKLFENGVTVRNQTVLLRGVNDNVAVMKRLIQNLADINILPYYVYQGDMVRGVEDLRTPLSTILDLEAQIRGSISGFMTPQFIVDLPGGGGKRLASSYKDYNRITGVSTFVAPAVTGDPNTVFKYHDPVWSIPSH